MKENYQIAGLFNMLDVESDCPKFQAFKKREIYLNQPTI